MKLLPDIIPEPNVEYYWKRTDGWKWLDGCEHWWEVFIVFYDRRRIFECNHETLRYKRHGS